jgi:hypothetical protein
MLQNLSIIIFYRCQLDLLSKKVEEKSQDGEYEQVIALLEKIQQHY